MIASTIAIIFAGGLLAVAIIHWDTVTRLGHLQFGVWPAESYIGKDLPEFKLYLRTSGQQLNELDQGGPTLGRTLHPNQRVFRFQEGEPYSLFGFSTAINLGYVLTARDADGSEKVEEIIRMIHLDLP